MAGPTRIHFENPVTIFAETMAQPLEEAARHWRTLVQEHADANDHLHQQGSAVSDVLGSRASQAFSSIVLKQHQYTKSITDSLQQLADMHQQAADQLRASARDADRVIAPFLSLVNHIMDQLTPDLIVREGEAPIHAVCADLRQTLDHLDHTTGNLLQDVFQLNFSGLVHDAQEEEKELGRLLGDALAALAVVEPALAQWAAQTQQAMTWLTNQGARLLNNVADHVFSIEDFFNAAAILYDPNALPQERLGAVFMIAFTLYQDITLFCPELDIFNFAMRGVFKVLEKTILKELLEAGSKLILEGAEKGLQKFLALFSREAGEEGAQGAEREALHEAEQQAANEAEQQARPGPGGNDGNRFISDSQGNSYEVPHQYRARYGNQVSADFEEAQKFRNGIVEAYRQAGRYSNRVVRDWSWPRRNVCFIRYELEDGTHGTTWAISGENSPVSHIPTEGPRPYIQIQSAPAVADNERLFNPTDFQFADTGNIQHPLYDSEDKALHQLARQLDRMQQQGSSSKLVQVYLYTEREPCPSCSNIIKQFEDRYSITVDLHYDFEYIGPSRNPSTDAAP
ncbi:deaminase domain-containing protein [Thermogemmatispora sp.]|uniref:deaminase domain-containing protein n=1 Tax=Thermogemmatispora sp. TaxID=1968838 RepID=UPI001D9BAAA5|nr:deaminase domain-containing protein [Thermogemmatispora sp.]MBX5450408.1 hypothetical protein [Thermogemmatispora sp.]